MAVLASYRERDPAARSNLEVALTSTGLHAVLWHQMCHALWKLGLGLFARMLANVGRWFFGIEIHPQARIGSCLFIDHGSGIVIGATAEIGDYVSIYQGVTLGGVTQTEKGKRHPTLEDRVVVGAGAKIIGPITIGADALVGSNAVVVKSVPAGTTVVGVPAHAATKCVTRKERDEFSPYGEAQEAAAEHDELFEQLTELRKEVEQLKAAQAKSAKRPPNKAQH